VTTPHEIQFSLYNNVCALFAEGLEIEPYKVERSYALKDWPWLVGLTTSFSTAPVMLRPVTFPPSIWKAAYDSDYHKFWRAMVEIDLLGGRVLAISANTEQLPRLVAAFERDFVIERTIVIGGGR
jgi:hypothetical protein